MKNMQFFRKNGANKKVMAQIWFLFFIKFI